MNIEKLKSQYFLAYFVYKSKCQNQVVIFLTTRQGTQAFYDSNQPKN